MEQSVLTTPEQGTILLNGRSRIVIQFPYDPDLHALATQIEGRKWNKLARWWDVPLASLPEVLEAFPGFDVPQAVHDAYERAQRGRKTTTTPAPEPAPRSKPGPSLDLAPDTAHPANGEYGTVKGYGSAIFKARQIARAICRPIHLIDEGAWTFRLVTKPRGRVVKKTVEPRRGGPSGGGDAEKA